jgi:acyl carrier protein
MNKPQLLNFLEDTLSMPRNTLTGSELVRDLPQWDSLSTLNFITMVDRKFGLALPASKVVRCQIVDELLALICGTPLLAA